MSDPAALGFDLSVNLGNVLTIAGAVAAIVWRASKMEQKLEAIEISREEIEKRRDEWEKKMEVSLGKVQDVMVILARQEERYNAMDSRLLATGKRVDDHQVTTAGLLQSMTGVVNSRLEAINNIVAGHTSQISILERRSGLHHE